MLNYLEDSAETIAYFNKLQLRGHYTGHYLTQVQGDLESVRDELVSRHTGHDHQLAEYVDAAL